MRIETLRFADTEAVPNNPTLPVLIWRAALPAADAAAGEFERRFARHGWQGCWRGDVYDYVHYHAHAHEVLGVARGHARLMLGGPDGQTLDVAAGDCLVLPAGTGHQCLHDSDDFEVVGAYPPGQSPDLQTEAPTDAHRAAIRALPLPPADPLEGAGGRLMALWQA